jgi:hypothetical protein
VRQGLRPFVYVVVLTLLLGILSACNPSDNPTPTLRGAFVPTRVSPTPRPTETATLTPSETLTPSATFTGTDLPTNTATATATVTSTLTASATVTLTPTVPTLTPTATLSETPILEATATTDSGLPVETPAEGTPQVNAIPIFYGETVRGTITNEEPRALYTFSGESGEIITIRMIAPNGDLDPYLKILNADGTVLEENDDFSSDTGRDSLITNYVLPISGTYTVMATRFDEERGIREGDFELTLTTGTYVDAPSTESIIPISYGDSVTGEISDEAYVVYYSFAGNAGDVITIELLSEDNLLDPLVVLIDPNAVPIIENDDSPERALDSLIENFTLPEAGQYLIAATRYEGISGNTTGQYTLILTQVSVGDTSTVATAISPIPPGEPVPPEITGTLILGQPINGVITPEMGMVVYGFDGQEGQNVSFAVRRVSGLFDPSLLIVGPDGREIAQNDDASRLNRDAVVDNLILAGDGQYLVMVTRSRQRIANGVGEFELLASEGTGEAPVSAVQPVELPPDTPINLQLSPQQEEAVASFYGGTGETIRLSLRRGGNLGISFIVLFPLTNEVLWQGTQETIDLTLPYYGHYSVMVFNRRGQGQVTVSYTYP